MSQPDPHQAPDDKEKVWRKQRVAQKQAAALKRRAQLLRKFAEKYRNVSTEQLYGWPSAGEQEEKGEI